MTITCSVIYPIVSLLNIPPAIKELITGIGFLMASLSTIIIIIFFKRVQVKNITQLDSIKTIRNSVKIKSNRNIGSAVEYIPFKNLKKQSMFERRRICNEQLTRWDTLRMMLLDEDGSGEITSTIEVITEKPVRKWSLLPQALTFEFTNKSLIENMLFDQKNANKVYVDGKSNSENELVPPQAGGGGAGSGMRIADNGYAVKYQNVKLEGDIANDIIKDEDGDYCHEEIIDDGKISYTSSINISERRSYSPIASPSKTREMNLVVRFDDLSKSSENIHLHAGGGGMAGGGAENSYAMKSGVGKLDVDFRNTADDDYST